ncbi:MAG: hypothetical protein K1X53_05870 [Candidatus Sumerlaeaceae bacterium]|nr:hypothetical protein [Candidatus Sumerlaeaceae bacterium]
MGEEKLGPSDADDELLSRICKILSTRLKANPYGWDGKLAEEIRALPPGLRAMAATHHLDISLTMDDIGWHFLNFGHPSHVEETELGLVELGLPEIAVIFREAYQLVQPHLEEIEGSEDYYEVMERVGAMKRINELTINATNLIGERGIYRYWVAYARQNPNRVFDQKAK